MTPKTGNIIFIYVSDKPYIFINSSVAIRNPTTITNEINTRSTHLFLSFSMSFFDSNNLFPPYNVAPHRRAAVYRASEYRRWL